MASLHQPSNTRVSRVSNSLRERLDDRVLTLIGIHPEWRYGQTVYNAAAHVHNAAAVSLVGTPLDPYHNDDAVEDFIEAWIEAAA